MLLNIISLFTGFICFSLGIFILSNKYKNNKTNIYFILILIVFGLVRFEYALDALNITAYNFNLLKHKASFSALLIPIFYLFFDKLIKQKTVNIKDLYYFAPTILVIISTEFSLMMNSDFYKYTNSIYNLGYFSIILKQLHHYFYQKKFDLKTTKYLQSIKTWAIIMLLLLTFIVILGLLVSFIKEDKNEMIQGFYQYSTFAWLYIFYYMFRNPVIVFGEQYLMKHIEVANKEDFLIWSKIALQKIEEKDLSVYIKCKEQIQNHIFNIKRLELDDQLLNKQVLKLDFLSKHLSIPKSHLEFMFKYHCHYSTNDYINLIKIRYALRLIANGYLNDMTINSLAEKTLFSARTTFFINFKKFMGIPITIYLNQKGVVPEKFKIYVNRA
jgi:AraC-like DNA-binding protein